jgi:hypothetical protein
MVLKPRIITSLRHVWSHPAFEDESGTHAAPSADKAAAMEQLTRMAAGCDITVDEMLAAAHERIDSGEYLCDGGRWEGIVTPYDFWPLFETVTGRKVPLDDRNNFFSCSC